MLVLLDENLPHRLRLLVPGHDVRTVDYQGWKSLSNGELLKVAEDAGFDAPLTSPLPACASRYVRYARSLRRVFGAAALG